MYQKEHKDILVTLHVGDKWLSSMKPSREAVLKHFIITLMKLDCRCLSPFSTLSIFMSHLLQGSEMGYFEKETVCSGFEIDEMQTSLINTGVSRFRGFLSLDGAGCSFFLMNLASAET